MFVIWCLSYSYKGDSGASVWNQGDSLRKCSRLRHQHSCSRQLAAQLGRDCGSAGDRAMSTVKRLFMG